MIRLGIGFGTAGVLLLVAACGDDAAPGPATAGAAGTATTAGTASGGSASGSSAGGMAGTATAGTATGGGGSSGVGGASGGSNNGGSAGASAGSGGSSAGSGGSGGSAGGGCDTTTGKALQFKGGTNDLVAGDLGDDMMGGNSARTVELWAHFTSAASWKGEGTVIELGRRTNAANQVFGIDMAESQNGRTNADAGKFDPYTNGIGDNDGATAMIPIVTWAHLAWGYDGAGHFEFFVNGTKVNLSKPGDGSGMLATTKGIVTLGASQGFGYEGWDGVMDEVRLWSVYRTEGDIKRDMKVKLKGTEAGLIAYYNLDEGTGETADDIKKTAGHQLKFCTAMGGACPVTNAAKPTWVASDIPGPFSCAP